MKALTLSSTSSGVCGMTRRTLNFRDACGGIAAFTPLPVQPPLMPTISTIGSAQERCRMSAGSSVRRDFKEKSCLKLSAVTDPCTASKRSLPTLDGGACNACKRGTPLGVAISDASCTSSLRGFRATPPQMPECTSPSAVSRETSNETLPRTVSTTKGRDSLIQIVSEQMHKSMRSGRRARMRSKPARKCGLPISSSISQMKETSTAKPCF
mmetsp:Transcript_126602/g.369948  ORF Transcript_126602/g.369948 Transcript_126602/m.369948 type:complete len:211 (-) Transcript_126602:619-1251(-)